LKIRKKKRTRKELNKKGDQAPNLNSTNTKEELGPVRKKTGGDLWNWAGGRFSVREKGRRVSCRGPRLWWERKRGGVEKKKTVGFTWSLGRGGKPLGRQDR